MSVMTAGCWGSTVDPPEVRAALLREGWSTAVEHEAETADALCDEEVRGADQIFVVTDGSVDASVGGSVYHLRPGDELLVPAQTPFKFAATANGSKWLCARRLQSARIPAVTAKVPADPRPHSIDSLPPAVTPTSISTISASPVSSSPECPPLAVPADFPCAGSGLALQALSSGPLVSSPSSQRNHQPRVSDADRQAALDAFHAPLPAQQLQCSRRIEQHHYISAADIPPPLPYVEFEKITFGGDHNRDLFGARLGVVEDDGEERVVVHALTAGGPAHIAGIGVLERIVSWDSVPIQSFKHFQELIKDAFPGQVVRVGTMVQPGSTHPHRWLCHSRSVVLSHQIAPFELPKVPRQGLTQVPKYVSVQRVR